MMKCSTQRDDNRRISLARAFALAWGAHVFYAVACAWPEVGGWPMLPGWVFAVACLVYGLVASWRGWPMLAGCASGCLAAPMLRAAVADHGAAVAGLGFTAATVLAAVLLMCSLASEVDDDGRVDAREVVLTLWLTGCIAAGGGLILADVAGWAVGHG